jgi:hypothetical protein
MSEQATWCRIDCELGQERCGCFHEFLLLCPHAITIADPDHDPPLRYTVRSTAKVTLDRVTKLLGRRARLP